MNTDAIELNNLNVKDINTTALAFMGDAVYEVYVRHRDMETGAVNAYRVHKMAVKYVRADGQAKAVKAMMGDGFLTDDEVALVKRARNHKTASKPKNADPVIYKLATAFEALIGYLYLTGERGRMTEIIFRAMEITEVDKP